MKVPTVAILNMSFNTRIVDDELEIHEDSLGFYEIENINGDTNCICNQRCVAKI